MTVDLETTESDADAIERFLDSNDAEAMRSLIRRHQGIVLAAAMRQVRRRDLAEDVAQAVFLVLIKKVETLRSKRSIAGWLIHVTRYAAIDAMRKQNRRLHHEEGAARLKTESLSNTEQAAVEWETLSNVLDDSLARLKEKDREAIVLRFFKDQPFAEVGRHLGLSEDAARKRVERALGRLREALVSKGVALPSAAIAPMLIANGTLPGTIAVDSLVAGSATTSVSTLAKGALRMIAWAKTKLIVAAALSGVAVFAVVAIAVQRYEPPVAGKALPTTTPADTAPASAGAVEIYDRASKLLVVDSPSRSNLEYPAFPPMGDAWTQLAADADVKNKPARDLVRTVREIDKAVWPVGLTGLDLAYLNTVREIANEVGDSALFLHLEKSHDAEALESIRDLRHLADLLRGGSDSNGLIRMLVAVGIDAVAATRLEKIAPGLNIQAAPDDNAVSPANVRSLIANLLSYKTAEEEVANAMSAEPGMKDLAPGEKAVAEQAFKPSLNRAKETVRRVHMERALAAMSLACQLYRFEHAAWPRRASDLVPAYVDQIPLDPFGDGTQTIGYVCIAGALPDGSDRPLVYSRCESQDGLFYRLDQPLYEFTTGDGRDVPSSQQRKGGQFRDVSRWVPERRDADAPTTAPLPAHCN